MKITIPVVIEIDDAAIERSSKNCNTTVEQFRVGIIEDKELALGDSLFESGLLDSGFRIDSSNTKVQ